LQGHESDAVFEVMSEKVAGTDLRVPHTSPTWTVCAHRNSIMSIAHMLWTKVIVVALRKCDVRCRSYEGIAGVAEAEVPVIAKSSQPPKGTSPFHFTSRVIHPRPCTQRLVVAR
jgi:hypothetical protein